MQNKYVHMTTSAMLPILPKTKFTLSNLHTLLYTYNLAPMSGEIYKGGTKGISEKGVISFAKFTLSENEHFNFDLLLKNYGNLGWESKISSEADLVKEIDDLCELGLITNLRAFLVTLLRHQQMGVLPQISSDIKERIAKELSSPVSVAIKQIITSYAIARYVEVIYDADGKTDANVMFDENLFNIYSYLPEDFMSKGAEEQLEIMKTIPISKGFRIYDFASEKHEPTYSDEAIEAQENYEYQLKNAMKCLDASNFIIPILKQVKKYNYFLDLKLVKSTVEGTLKNLFLATSLLESIMNNTSSHEFSDMEKSIIHEAFPIALIVDRDQCPLEQVKYEYRSNSNLVLGEDIKIIATDEQHLEKLKTFCAQHDALRNIQVFTFDQVRQNNLKSEMPCHVEFLQHFGFYGNNTDKQVTQNLMPNGCAIF